MVCPALDAKVWVAFSDGQETGTLFGVALSLAAAPGKPLATVAAALAELFTEILRLDQISGLITISFISIR